MPPDCCNSRVLLRRQERIISLKPEVGCMNTGNEPQNRAPIITTQSSFSALQTSCFAGGLRMEAWFSTCAKVVVSIGPLEVWWKCVFHDLKSRNLDQIRQSGFFVKNKLMRCVNLFKNTVGQGVWSLPIYHYWFSKRTCRNGSHEGVAASSTYFTTPLLD